MRTACRKVLLLTVLVELGLVAGWANAEDAGRDGSRQRQREQIARTVEGSAPITRPVEGSTPITRTVEGSPAAALPVDPGSYTTQNDLLTGPSLLINTAREPAAADWMAPSQAPDLADPGRDGLAVLNDEAEVQVDPSEPKSIELDEGVRGNLKVKGSGATIGIAIDFW
jgi:hypothetical protein